MTLHVAIRSNTYYDSVTLMQVSSALADMPGVEAASVVMATELNLRYLSDAGLMTPEAQQSGPNDLVIAVRASSAEQAQAAHERATRVLATRGGALGPNLGDGETLPRSIASALRRAADAPLVLISVPGAYAAAEARQALAAGLHVFLFSDNVPVAQEVELKRFAVERGLLLMGPECGTAIVDGLGLGFANAVRSGDVGLVGASGTGVQEVSVLLHGLGRGISQAIGTGGRDLSAAVGGLMTRQAIRLLADDPDTRSIVLVSKPPSRAVALEALAWLVDTGKPAVACFLSSEMLGLDESGHGRASSVRVAATLEAAVSLATGQAAPWDPGAELLSAARQERARLSDEQHLIVGLFSGGSLAEEASIVLGPKASARLFDLGAAEYTVGRPHPMIDPTLRMERLLHEAQDPEVGVVLLDMLLGYGAHLDPAGALAPAILQARQQAEQQGRYLPVVAHVCGTDADPQGLARQQATLGRAGALVAPTNAMAARLAAAIVGGTP